MKEIIKTQGPAVAAEQLIDVYRSTQDQTSPWVVISDQVMGAYPLQHFIKTSVISQSAAV